MTNEAAHSPPVPGPTVSAGRAPRAAVVNALIGVVIFSGSLPATRVAVASFDPVFLTFVRAAVAGLCGAALLAVFSPALPARRHLPRLALVAAGVVLGFPLLTALALLRTTAAHALVVIGLLPLATALFAVVLGGERPRLPFWIFAVCGAASVAVYAVARGGGAAGGDARADLLLVGAVLLCGLGYAEGARLARSLGGWQVISWALVISLPGTIGGSVLVRPDDLSAVTPAGFIALGYVSLFSMLIGFVFWYRGLALGSVAALGQVQLLQPFFGLAAAALLLGEAVGPDLVAVAAAVVACVAGARRFAG